MISIEIRDGLPYITLVVANGDSEVELRNALLDTGSHSTLLATDSVASIKLRPELFDKVQEIFSIGGSETVVEKHVPRIALAEGVALNFPVELGAMDYGLALDAIVGLDLLREMGAIIDLQSMHLHVAKKGSADAEVYV